MINNWGRCFIVHIGYEIGGRSFILHHSASTGSDPSFVISNPIFSDLLPLVEDLPHTTNVR